MSLRATSSKSIYNKKRTGKVRLISGQWRGYKVPVLNVFGLRPTTDRIRETLFNWLTPYIQHAHCLDCFAGSGVLGLEALSRYAASTTLLEIKYSVANQLKKNLKILNTNRGKVINTNSLQWLRQQGTPFNVVFVDPPYREGILEKTLQLLEQQGWLSNNSLIYVESEVDNNTLIVPMNWEKYRAKSTKQIFYCLYKRR